MKTLIYLIAIAMLIAGVVLVVADFPFEAAFPAMGPVLVGLGLMANLAVYAVTRRKS